MSDLTVACVLKKGPYQGRDYTPDYVYRLRDQVKEHLSIPHRFVCLTDMDVPDVTTVKLIHGWPGWWSKLELFSRVLGKRVLYLDLDVDIVGDLDDIANFPADIAMMVTSRAWAKKRKRKENDPRHVHRYQTSCMVWSPPAGLELYAKFTPRIMDVLHSDQDWISKIGDYATFPIDWFRKASDEDRPEGLKVLINKR